MPIYAVVNKATGQFDADCEHCAIRSISGGGIDDRDVRVFESAATDDGHVMIEISSAEREELIKIKYTVERNGEVFTTHEQGELEYFEREKASREPAAVIDMNKASRKIEDREIVDVPIEIDGIGGKEIIGYEEKPIGIVVERELSSEKGKTGKE